MFAHPINFALQTLFRICAAGTIAAGMLASCSKEQEPASMPVSTNIPVESHSIADRAARPMVLGAQKQNPYSVENMQRALDTLLLYAKTDPEAASLKSLENVEVQPTDLYVRFLARDSASDRLHMDDTTLLLISWPLDYEIAVEVDYYRDPSVTGPYTWQYTVVKPGYSPPQGVSYEVLAELYIVEHDPTYTEEIIEDTTSSLKSGPAGISGSAGRALTAVSYSLCGYIADEDEDGGTPQSSLKETCENCSKRCIGVGRWYKCWNDCNTTYYPDGTISVRISPDAVYPLAGVKVRIVGDFKIADARTDANGYYYCNERFDKQPYPYDCARYSVVFYRRNGSNTWNMSQSLSGATTPTTASFGAGVHSPSGHSVTFHDGSDYWGIAVQHKAIYDYIRFAQMDGVTLPPQHLEVATDKKSDLSSGAPLLMNHINTSMMRQSPYFGLHAQAMLWSMSGLLSDLILKFQNSYSKFYDITSIAYHELTHASQLERMKAEKGLLWASDYWSINVMQQAKNSMQNGSPYGGKDKDNWQIIALSEGWAKYREWRMSQDYLGYDTKLTKYYATFQIITP